eukprot:TRINITY_DN41781_c0_g1_i2.p1 TRINITY_DN41781_c0_g1~~TRINITY_DN41781_c0_g1_i2.p1  ORF type:complete len:123 (+),score=34.50 TRINITY_DN41781_c0_g1_i2:240-608(+)
MKIGGQCHAGVEAMEDMDDKEWKKKQKVVARRAKQRQAKRQGRWDRKVERYWADLEEQEANMYALGPNPGPVPEVNSKGHCGVTRRMSFALCEAEALEEDAWLPRMYTKECTAMPSGLRLSF